jgi:hypothetical protein
VSGKREIMGLLAELDSEDRLTPDDVIKAAQDKESPLHAQFEWDNTAAAHAYRQAQARELIRSFRVTVQIGVTVVKVPQWVRDPEREPNEQGYTALISVKSNAAIGRDLLATEFARARSALERANNIAAALSMDGPFEELLGLMDKAEKKISKARAAKKRA